MPQPLQHVLEAGGTEVATSAGGARRYRKPLKDFRWKDIECIFSASFDEWNKHNAPRLGASLAFYTLLSIAPLILVLVSVVGMVMGREAAEANIVNQVQNVVGSQGGTAVKAVLQSSHNTTHGILATAFGLLTLLFGASGVLVELRDALNIIWEVPTPEMSKLRKITSFIKQRLFSFALVLSMGFIMVVSLLVSAWISALSAWSASIFPGAEVILHVINFVVFFFIITALFSAIYKILPDVKIEWRDVILGGAVTSVLFSIGKLGLGIYLGRATFASMYGAAASIVVLIVWVYYSGQIFFLGAEFTKTFANSYGSQPSRHPEGMVVDGTKPATATNSAIEEPKKLIVPD